MCYQSLLKKCLTYRARSGSKESSKLSVFIFCFKDHSRSSSEFFRRVVHFQFKTNSRLKALKYFFIKFGSSTLIYSIEEDNILLQCEILFDWTPSIEKKVGMPLFWT